ncbi:glutathione S-transferase [Nitzschia inconspicua]|uniref:Glutathione S-transferase n=1 Tax=Nitzschia inconspicua TaxID=303405 RepID=A0A9K3KFX1_9STRA|nr:glutathione S-transferase [Nitzschia inconspicua]
MKLYAMPLSGNCYKVAWALHRLGIQFEMVLTTFVDGGTKKPDFLEKNPNGQVPLLELDDGRRLAESNAIMLYIEETYGQLKSQQQRGIPPLIPKDGFERAMMYQWMFFEQYTHEPSIAVRRANVLFQRDCPKDKMAQLLENGTKALNVMEQQLSKTLFIVGNEMTLADMSLFAYTHVAHEGEYDLSNFPHIQNWLDRVTTSSGFCTMDILETRR